MPLSAQYRKQLAAIERAINANNGSLIKTKGRGCGKRKCNTKGGSLKSLWDHLIHPIDHIQISRKLKKYENMGEDIVEELTDEQVEDLLQGVYKRGKRLVPRKKKSSGNSTLKKPSESEIDDLLKALTPKDNDPLPAGQIKTMNDGIF